MHWWFQWALAMPSCYPYYHPRSLQKFQAVSSDWLLLLRNTPIRYVERDSDDSDDMKAEVGRLLEYYEIAHISPFYIRGAYLPKLAHSFPWVYANAEYAMLSISANTHLRDVDPVPTVRSMTVVLGRTEALPNRAWPQIRCLVIVLSVNDDDGFENDRISLAAFPNLEDLWIREDAFGIDDLLVEDWPTESLRMVESSGRVLSFPHEPMPLLQSVIYDYIDTIATEYDRVLKHANQLTNLGIVHITNVRVVFPRLRSIHIRTRPDTTAADWDRLFTRTPQLNSLTVYSTEGECPVSWPSNLEEVEFDELEVMEDAPDDFPVFDCLLSRWFACIPSTIDIFVMDRWSYDHDTKQLHEIAFSGIATAPPGNI